MIFATCLLSKLFPTRPPSAAGSGAAVCWIDLEGSLHVRSRLSPSTSPQTSVCEPTGYIRKRWRSSPLCASTRRGGRCGNRWGAAIAVTGQFHQSGSLDKDDAKLDSMTEGSEGQSAAASTPSQTASPTSCEPSKSVTE